METALCFLLWTSWLTSDLGDQGLRVFSISFNQGWNGRGVHKHAHLLPSPANHSPPAPAAGRSRPQSHTLDWPRVSDSSKGKNSRVLTSSEGQRQVQSSRAPGRSVLAHPSFCPELLWANLYQAGEASTPLTRAGQDLPRTPLSNHPLGHGGSSSRK